MENNIKTYEEFSGGKEITEEKAKAYMDYIKSVTQPAPEPEHKSDIWPTPKNKKA